MTDSLMLYQQEDIYECAIALDRMTIKAYFMTNSLMLYQRMDIFLGQIP